MWIGIGMVIGVYCVLVGGLFAFQRRLMYFPAKMTAPRLVLRGVQDTFSEAAVAHRGQKLVCSPSRIQGGATN
jgi:hypothetical protein